MRSTLTTLILFVGASTQGLPLYGIPSTDFARAGAGIYEYVQPLTGSYGAPVPKVPVPTVSNPVVTEVPAVTEVPGVVTEVPAITEAPVVTLVPNATEVPAVTEAPVISEAPVVTEVPVPTEVPTQIEIPTVTEVPVPTEVPAETDTPYSDEVTVSQEIPSRSDVPAVSEEIPSTTEGPAVPQVPSATEDPAPDVTLPVSSPRETPSKFECIVSSTGFEPNEISVKKGDIIAFKMRGGANGGIRTGSNGGHCVPFGTETATLSPTGERVLNYIVPQDALDKIYFYNVEGDQCTQAEMTATLNVGNNLVAEGNSTITDGNSTTGGLSRPPIKYDSSAASTLPTLALVGVLSVLSALSQL